MIPLTDDGRAWAERHFSDSEYAEIALTESSGGGRVTRDTVSIAIEFCNWSAENRMQEIRRIMAKTITRRDQHYIEDRLLAPDDALGEAIERLRQLGFNAEVGEVMAASQTLHDACYALRQRLFYFGNAS